MENHGLDLEKEVLDRTDEDWEYLGATNRPQLFIVSASDRVNYLPQGEVQFGREDMQDCVTRAYINKIEHDVNYMIENKLISDRNKQWLKDKGYMNVTTHRVEFSDAFNAILSGTTRYGNSMIAPAKSIHKDGLIPKKLLPLDKSMLWKDYHDPVRITSKLKKLGKEFAKRFSINYERVYEQDYPSLLEHDLLIVAGYAWPSRKNDEYIRVENTPNHAFLAIRPQTFIFDNYEEGKGDFIKKLAKDYNFLDYGYRLWIAEEKEVSHSWILEKFKKFIWII